MIARPQSARGNGATPTGPVRVAIYCRQSVERETGGEFGSIDAQREACEAYVGTQREQQWRTLPARYDDLGLSGKTTDRPAFQRLLADIESHQVDAVIVYRLDRLSRSTADLFRLLDFFQQYGTTFVSVTEQFNTTTPMGRFALSILGVVAQLEREVTAERVRDKIAASRKRGLWTGGRPPLGYDSVGGKLVVDANEAEAVRAIAAAYLEWGSLTATLEVLRERGIAAKGGVPFTVATLRNLLHSPLIGGRINAGDRIVKAQHEAILDEPTWEALKAKLAEPQAPVARRRRSPSGALLANLVRCGRCGASWSAHYTAKVNGRRYGAYTCQSVIRKGAATCPGSRVPARELEAFVIDRVRAIGRDPELLREAVAAAAGELKAQRDNLAALVKRLDADANRLREEHARLVDTISQAGQSVPELVERLAGLRGEVEDAETALRQAKADLAACKRQTIDEGELRRAIQSFDGVWEHLFPAERQRILALLIERVTVTASPDGEDIAITYSAEGARTLLAETTPEAP